MILPNNRKHVHAWRRRGAEHFNDFAFGINVARLPSTEANYYFVAYRAGGLGPPILRGMHINIVHRTWIIGYDVVETASPLQRTDAGRVTELDGSILRPGSSSVYGS